MKIKEIKERLDIDLTKYEDDIIFLCSLMEGVKLAFNGLWDKNYSVGLNRKDLHAFSSLLECLQRELKEFDDKFYSEVIEKVENEVAEKITTKK